MSKHVTSSLQPAEKHLGQIWGGSPKIRGTISGVSVIRIVVFLGSISGSPFSGEVPFRCMGCKNSNKKDLAR